MYFNFWRKIGNSKNESRQEFEIEIDTFSVKAPKTIGVDETFCQKAVAAALYRKGILTMKQARQLIGKSRREFEEEVLPEFGYTPMDGEIESGKIETEASEWH